ncbi:MAG: MFS transporter [Candidatus Dormibacteria bacterium]
MTLRSRSLLIGASSLGIILTAADTYVVVILLPAMMSQYGLPVTALEKGAPIVSGFLFGYILALPVFGKWSDLSGRTPLMLIAIALFGAGSFITAHAPTLGTAVIGRFLQGTGGGALLPLTYARTADLWSGSSRGLPLGVVSAAQEVGSLAGPLLGAGVLVLGSWQDAFLINILLIAIIGPLLYAGNVDRPVRFLLWCIPCCIVCSVLLFWVGNPLLTALGVWGWCSVAGVLAVRMFRQARHHWAAGFLLLGISFILISVPDVSVFDILLQNAGLSPVGPFGVPVAVLFGGMLIFLGAILAWKIPIRSLHKRVREVDAVGFVLLAGILAIAIIPVSNASPGGAAIPPSYRYLLPVAALFVLLLILQERRATSPLIPPAALHSPSTWIALLLTLGSGIVLIAILVDIPIEAQAFLPHATAATPAFILLSFLTGTAIGAVIGGMAVRFDLGRISTALGFAGSCISLLAIASWSSPSWWILLATGLALGSTIAPLTACLLECTPLSLHGTASSLLVMARLLGMVIGLGLLTTIGLHAFTVASAALPSPLVLCHGEPTCALYEQAVLRALHEEMHSIFTVSAAAAGALAVLACVSILVRSPSLWENPGQ